MNRKNGRMIVMDDLPFSQVATLGFVRIMIEDFLSYLLRPKYYSYIKCEKKCTTALDLNFPINNLFKKKKIIKVNFLYSNEWSDT